MLKSKAPMSSILNPARPYIKRDHSDITKSPAWQAALAARELRETERLVKVIAKSNVRRMK